jgi:PAS domain S-box-containing protein
LSVFMQNSIEIESARGAQMVVPPPLAEVAALEPPYAAWRKASHTAAVLGLAAIYLLAARLGWLAAPRAFNVSPVWPPAGIAVAVLLLFGYRLWPGILLGAFIAYATSGLAPGRALAVAGSSIGIALASSLEALTGAWLTRRFAGGQDAFEQPQTVFRFVALTAMLSTIITPTLGLLALSLAGLTNRHFLATSWLTGWLANLSSVLVLTPLLLAWRAQPLSKPTPKRVWEAIGLLASLVLVCGTLFGGWFFDKPAGAPLALVLVPLLLWPALRFGPGGTASAIGFIAVVSILGTLHGAGPFVVDSRASSLFLVQEFVGVLAVMALALTADVAQRKSADASLRASGQRYRALFQANPQPMWVHDCDTFRFLAVNDAALQLYGYSREEFLRLSLSDIVGAHDTARQASSYPNALAMLAQRRHRKSNGQPFDAQVTWRDAQFDGRPAVMVLTTDVTERKRAEQRAASFSVLGRRLSAARTPEQAAQIIADTADTLLGWDVCSFHLCSPSQDQLKTILKIDRIGSTTASEQPATGVASRSATASNLSALKEVSISAQQPPNFNGWKFSTDSPQMLLFPELAFLPVEAALAETQKPGTSQLSVPVRRHERTLGVLSIQSRRAHAYTEEDQRSLQALADHCGGALERIRAEAAWRESDERLRLALSAGRMGTWTIELSPQYRILPSPEMEAIFGLKPGEFPGTLQALSEMTAPQDHGFIQESIARAIQNEGEYQIEFRFLPRDRPMGWILARGRAYRDAEGRPVRLAGVGIDITQLKHAEQEVRRLNEELEARVRSRTSQLEAINRELEAFSYSVSHDLRAPLRSIRGFSEVLLERYADKLDARGREFLARATQSSQHMDELIEGLLKLSRVGRSELSRVPVDLSALALSIMDELHKSEPKRKVQWSIARNLHANGDESLLRLVLENLLRNAWKFTAKKSKPQIEFGFTDDPQPAFFVRDNGAGFDMNYADKLFGVFQRLHPATDFPGTGIGLATVQRIVNRHGGRVWASGVINQGATFFFSLPGEGSS